jgi:hypothetical protein
LCEALGERHQVDRVAARQTGEEDVRCNDDLRLNREVHFRLKLEQFSFVVGNHKCRCQVAAPTDHFVGHEGDSAVAAEGDAV